MGKSQPLKELLAELAIYEATVSTWEVSEEAACRAAQNTA